MIMRFERHFLFVPVWFLMGVWFALMWVSGTLENTFDLWKPGHAVPAEVLDRERHAVLDARSVVGLVTVSVLVISSVVDAYLRRKAKGRGESTDPADQVSSV
jgi:hypothetical protein